MAGEDWFGTIKFKLPNNGMGSFAMSVSPIKITGQPIKKFIVNLRDISKQLAFENRLRQSQKLEAIGTLAGGIAHDFNNILFSIMGNIELSLGELSAPDDEQNLNQNLREAYAASRRAQSLVRQILVFSRNEALSFTPVDLGKVIAESIKMLRASIPTRIALSAEILTKACIEADITQLHQVLLNLCMNSYYAINGSGEIKIRLRELSEGESQEFSEIENHNKLVCIEVIDNGCGLEKDLIDKIFDPFFTTRDPGEGTGLGLSVVHGIIKQAGGQIKVISEPKIGSTFSIYLPTCIADIPENDQFELPLDSVDYKILVIDDEEMICSIYRRGLKRIGYQVETFSDSEEALSHFTQNSSKYDLVITDMMMPKLTGIDLAKAMLALEPDMPIILCSGFLRDIEEEELYKNGIKAFLEKPIIIRELDMVIRSCLDEEK
jgi:signal transduction histidine kinase/ActR/RegA family two-component response regulator